MKWILEHFQLVVVIVGAFVIWLKNLFDRKVAERRERENPPDSDDAEVWEEYREVLEERPPIPPPLPPPRQPGYHEAVAKEAAAAEKHRQKEAGRRRKIQENKADTTGDAAATRARVTAKSTKAVAVATPTRLRSRLRQPAEMRRAVVMREILGPPVGLR